MANNEFECVPQPDRDRGCADCGELAPPNLYLHDVLFTRQGIAACNDDHFGKALQALGFPKVLYEKLVIQDNR